MTGLDAGASLSEQSNAMLARLPAGWRALVAEQGECLIWTGHLRRDGYGKLRNRQAHRVFYELLVGPIADGLELDHLCRNVRCVLPRHLEPVTRAENMRRRYATYTHCKNGHEFSPENTYRKPSGHRMCRPCNREAVRRLKQRKQAAS